MSALKVLEKTDEVDREVTWEDQRNINQFSKLTVLMDTLEERLKAKKTEKEYLDDLETELELADEDEPIKYKVGESFVEISLSECQERIQDDSQKLDGDLGKIQEEMDKVTGDLAKLKALLYGKFGKSINLERD